MEIIIDAMHSAKNITVKTPNSIGIFTDPRNITTEYPTPAPNMTIRGEMTPVSNSLPPPPRLVSKTIINSRQVPNDIVSLLNAILFVLNVWMWV